MKVLLVLSFLILGLVTVNCGAQSSDVEKANMEVDKIEMAINACLSDADAEQLDSAVVAWNGSLGKVTATSENGTVYDAGNYIQDMVFRATYDISQDGLIIDAHNISWKGVEFDATYPQISHWVKAP